MMREPVEVKCVVWDLDNTVWSGILLEGDTIRLRDGVRETIETLDARGIVHSIASRNDPVAAWDRVRQLGLDPYFLYPQIGWSTKSSSIKAIASELNIGLNTIAFVDDDPVELGEVASALPEVLCISADDVADMPGRRELTPRFITRDSARRRHMYRAEMQRRQLEAELPASEFLASLSMVLTISTAGREDLERIHELTLRTNQLNSTGRTFSFEELDRLRVDPNHLMLIAELDDRFGAYGKIGFALAAKNETSWLLKSILMSCRVMSRGIGTPLLNQTARLAQQAGSPLRAEFIRTEKNRFMYFTLKLAGFQELERSGSRIILERDSQLPIVDPEYLTVECTATDT